MDIKARQKDNVIVLDLFGRIDVNSANFVEIVGRCVHDGYSDILCNFAGVDVIDYMGISVIVIAYKEVDNNEGRMKFANVPAHLQSILSIAGLDKAIDIYATEDLAMASFKEDKIIEDIKKMQLRRRFKRLPIGIKVDIASQNPNGPQCLRSDVCNLSALGAYIYGCDKFELGDEVILKLKLSPHAKEMELTAKVVWLSDKQIQPQFHPGMGIAFHKISTSVQQKLVNFIDKNLSRMPSD